MKACVITGYEKVALQEVAIPSDSEKNVILKVAKVGICGSDVHIAQLEDRVGVILGHEFSGVVEDPGSDPKLKKGDRVVVRPSGPNPPWTSYGIRTAGGYAEYVAIHPGYADVISDNISDTAAAMIEPMAVSMKACDRGSLHITDKVLVMGAGIIGLGCAEFARLAGVDYLAVSEVNDTRLEIAQKRCPVDQVFDSRDPDVAKKMMEATGGGFTKVIDCTGVGPAIELGIQVLRRSRTLVFVGVNTKAFPFHSLPLVQNDISMVGSYGSGPQYFADVSRMLEHKRLEPEKYITADIRLEEVPAMFDAVCKGAPEVKVMISPNG